MGRRKYGSEHLRIVVQAFQELGVKVAHRSQIIEKWREIRNREGLKPIDDSWVDHVLHKYPELFKSTKKRSGNWEYIGTHLVHVP
jgi:hypothetical protein